MLRFLFVLALFAVATYLLVRVFQERGLMPSDSAVPAPTAQAVAPDDDEDFLRDLDRRAPDDDEDFLARPRPRAARRSGRARDVGDDGPCEPSDASTGAGRPSLRSPSRCVPALRGSALGALRDLSDAGIEHLDHRVDAGVGVLGAGGEVVDPDEVEPQRGHADQARIAALRPFQPAVARACR